MRISSFVDHELSKGHLKATEVKTANESTNNQVLNSDSGRALMSMKTADKNRICNLFRNAHAIAKKNRPLSDYVWISEGDQSKGLAVGQTYLNEKAALGFISSIAEVEQNKTVTLIKDANFFSFIMDGSTDISGDEQESLYIRSSFRGNLTERFLCIGTPPSTSSQDLFNYIMDVFDSHGID